MHCANRTWSPLPSGVTPQMSVHGSSVCHASRANVISLPTWARQRLGHAHALPTGSDPKPQQQCVVSTWASAHPPDTSRHYSDLFSRPQHRCTERERSLFCKCTSHLLSAAICLTGPSQNVSYQCQVITCITKLGLACAQRQRQIPCKQYSTSLRIRNRVNRNPSWNLPQFLYYKWGLGVSLGV